MNDFFKLASVLVFTAILNTGNAYAVTTNVNNGALVLNNTVALTSNANDGPLVLNNALTLTAFNNKVFNYTIVDLQTGSTLDFSGLNSGNSVFILGTGDITLNGIINLPSFTSFTFETAGNILFGGSVLTSNSNVSFISNSFSSTNDSVINDVHGSISITAGSGGITANGTITVWAEPLLESVQLPSPVHLIELTPVPEPFSYTLLTLGLLTLTSRYRRLHS